MNDLPETLTLAQVAAIFLVAEITVRRWVKKSHEGESRFPKPIGTRGARLRFSKDAILEYLKHGESSPVATSGGHKDAMESLRRRGVVK